ncbi:MAG: PPC domain-containing protein [Chloroflexi bacterium]|nr:PPC domain-containing protein [Chloroflexota bacterium]
MLDPTYWIYLEFTEFFLKKVTWSDMKLRILCGLILGSLLLVPMPVSPQIAQANRQPQFSRTLKPFQPVTGQLGEGLVLEEWKFEGQTGQMISLLAEKTSGDLDVVITLLNPNAETMAANDNASFDTTDARLEALPLVMDGTYSVRVYREGGGFGKTSGEYQLTLLNGYSQRDTDRRTSAVVNLGPGELLARESIKTLAAEDFYLEFAMALPETTDPYTLEFRLREVPQNSHYWSFQLASDGVWLLNLQNESNRTLEGIEGRDPLELALGERVEFSFWQSANIFFVAINHTLVAQLDTSPDMLPTEAGEAAILIHGDTDHTENIVATLREVYLTNRFYADEPPALGAIGPNQPGERIYAYKGTPQQIVDELRASEFIPTMEGGVQAKAVEAFIFTSDVGFSAYPMLGENPYQNYVLGFSAALLEGPTDTACGVIFRQQDGANFATMLFTPLGQVYFINYENGEAAPDGLAIESPAIFPGINQNNWFTIVANGEQGSLFVNGRLIGQIALQPVAGMFAVNIVIATPETAYCRLQNVWMWTLGR